MAKENQNTAQQQYRSWWKPLLDETVQRMIKDGAVKGAAVEANPVWILPERILISRVWAAAQKSQFVWAIAGEAVYFDHIGGDLAVDAQAVARHFSLKWQMDAERLRALAKRRSTTQAERISAQADRLVQCAEMMYDLSSQDELWKEHPAS
jgi:hypothetical protein